MGLAVGTAAAPAAAVVTGPLDLVAGVLAFAIDPNTERFINVATL